MNYRKIIKEFGIGDTVVSMVPIQNGHINVTFLVVTENYKYILQRINHTVFKDVKGLMSNFYHITEFLKENGYCAPQLVKTNKGELYTKEGDMFFRLYSYIDDVICYEGVHDLKTIYKTGQSFGILHKSLKNFNAELLNEVIPNFHNTQQRYLNFLDALKTDKLKRAKTCLPEIQMIKKYKKEYSKIVDGIAKGDIHLSVTHNDPKINNILFDKLTGQFKAVIDLDTIMPGSYLYDVGDALRSLFTGEYEDSKDLSKINVNFDIFEAYVSGYLKEMKDVLNDYEKSLVSFSAFLITMECGIRFLEDYLRGDVYFHTSYSDHNLVRARTQIKLASQIYDLLPQLDEIVNESLK